MTASKSFRLYKQNLAPSIPKAKSVMGGGGRLRSKQRFSSLALTLVTHVASADNLSSCYFENLNLCFWAMVTCICLQNKLSICLL